MCPERFVVKVRHTRPFLITFSGIDGAGKTTQIELLSSYLQKQGLRVLRFSFWDHVAVWPRLRAGVGYRAADLYHLNQPEGSCAPKNHKHIRNWYLTAARSGLYILDILRLRRLLGGQPVAHSDVVIFDRYVYDQIANIYSRSQMAKMYIRSLLKHIPCPDVAFLLDATPADAFARKPEYPVEFMHHNREAFLRLREFFPDLIPISGAAVEDVEREILAHVRRVELGRIAEDTKTDAAAESAVGRQQRSCRSRSEPTASG